MKTKKKEMVICKQCGEEYDRNEVARINGKESSVLHSGCCSARCYTKKVTGV